MTQINEHCKDCCCARAWNALGITEYTGKSIAEHIAELKAPRTISREELEEYEWQLENYGARTALIAPHHRGYIQHRQ